MAHFLGQIFLKDTKYIEKISSCIPAAGRILVEIGGGKGAITDILSRRARFVYCIELDKNLCVFLRKKFKNRNSLKIINADILKTDIEKLGDNLIVCGNIPYYISSELIVYMVFRRSAVEKAYFTVQKEFARRLTAQPGDEGYGYMSCYIQYYAKLKKIFDIPKGAFLPHPKINSSFIEFDFSHRSPLSAEEERVLFEIIQKAFSNRRKKVINSLKKDLPVLEQKAKKTDILNLRPQDLSLEDYIHVLSLCKE
ncbi:MAG: ribosomal RNA small subunit methyltransferase A [Candidatus Omnitrophica bacterium]|nr:ribosomal RNA small subunit methyltransferase A [Candidatus Omnitrophota bacterium]MBD3268753.1 ribosomal RNA small subunit methyltransferase A [Candidatus Omnitrophota bacterium]